MEKLKPCPFCGNEVVIYSVEPHEHPFLKSIGVEMPDCDGETFIECCGGCGVCMSAKTENEAVEKWNNRFALPYIKDDYNIQKYNVEITIPFHNYINIKDTDKSDFIKNSVIESIKKDAEIFYKYFIFNEQTKFDSVIYRGILNFILPNERNCNND